MAVSSQGHYGFHSFPVVDWFCLFIYLWVLIVRSSVILLLPLFINHFVIIVNITQSRAFMILGSTYKILIQCECSLFLFNRSVRLQCGRSWIWFPVGPKPDYNICICSINTRHYLRSKSTDYLALNHDNVFK